jgi:acetyl/propionyl-CoA carboxylase alpha subunit
MHHAFKLDEQDFNLELSRAQGGYRLHVGEQIIPVRLELSGGGDATLTIGGETVELAIATRGDDVFIHLDGASYHLHYEHPLERLAHQLHGGAEDAIRAPMPGSLVAIHVKAGQAVKKGEALLVMESMKMETTIAAPRDGVVAEVHFATAQTFDRDALLLTLEPA